MMAPVSDTPIRVGDRILQAQEYSMRVPSDNPNDILQGSMLPSAGQPAAMGPQPTPTTPSPTKSQLKSHTIHLRQELEEFQRQAHHTFDQQRQGFEDCANRYQSEARDITQVEVAQGEARERAKYQGQLDDARKHVDSVVQRATQHLDEYRRASTERVHTVQTEADFQRQQLIQEAEDALHQQRQTIVGQAEDGIRDAQESRGLGDVYKRQMVCFC